MKVVAISGWTATGKTSFAYALAKALRPHTAIVLSQDDYYRDHSHLSREERTDWNYDEPAAYDLEALRAALDTLRSGGVTPHFAYDFVSGARSEIGTLGPAEVVIVEGFLVLWDSALREAADLRIFLEGELPRLLERRTRRDGKERAYTPEEVKRRFEEMVIPEQGRYLRDAPTHADLTFSMDWSEPEVTKAATTLHTP